MDIVIFVVCTSLLAFSPVLLYRLGYRRGAKMVLDEWKKTLEDWEELK